MTKKDIRNLGFSRGNNIASWADVPEVGTPIDWDVDWIGLGETVTEENQREYMELLCAEAESNDRQNSPFEFTAHELNEMADSKPYDVWEVFEDGIRAGIRANLRKRFGKERK